jgi:beta-lactamase class A
MQRLENRRQEKLKKLIRFYAVIFGICFIAIIIHKFMQSPPKVIAPISNDLLSLFLLQKQPDESLEKAVQQQLKGATGSYSVEIYNLKTQEHYGFNSDKTYDSGSLYKLWIMATAFDQIKKGTLKEDEVLSSDVEKLNNEFNIDDDYAELTEGTVTLSVSSALKQMITISHNYAALLLTERVTLSDVSLFLQKNGFTKSKVGVNGETPTTTASDIRLFFEKLYKGEIINKEYSNKMLDLLKQQKLNNKLPKYIPQGTVIAHKTGELTSFSHDGGIVYGQTGDYIIVVLTDTTIPSAAEDRIAAISKSVYNYFMKDVLEE